MKKLSEKDRRQNLLDVAEHWLEKQGYRVGVLSEEDKDYLLDVIVAANIGDITKVPVTARYKKIMEEVT